MSLLIVIAHSHIRTEPEKGADRITRLFRKAVAEAQAVAVKGLLSFVGFMLIGMFFGETFASLSAPAIGISVGNIVGHALHLLPPDTLSVAQV